MYHQMIDSSARRLSLLLDDCVREYCDGDPKALFPLDYGMPAEYREQFEYKFWMKYRFYNINFDSFAMFKHQLHAALLEAMPRYIKLYQSENVVMNPFVNEMMADEAWNRQRQRSKDYGTRKGSRTGQTEESDAGFSATRKTGAHGEQEALIGTTQEGKRKQVVVDRQAAEGGFKQGYEGSVDARYTGQREAGSEFEGRTRREDGQTAEGGFKQAHEGKSDGRFSGEAQSGESFDGKTYRKDGQRKDSHLDGVFNQQAKYGSSSEQNADRHHNAEGEYTHNTDKKGGFDTRYTGEGSGEHSATQSASDKASRSSEKGEAQEAQADIATERGGKQSSKRGSILSSTKSAEKTVGTEKVERTTDTDFATMRTTIDNEDGDSCSNTSQTSLTKSKQEERRATGQQFSDTPQTKGGGNGNKTNNVHTMDYQTHSNSFNVGVQIPTSDCGDTGESGVKGGWTDPDSKESKVKDIEDHLTTQTREDEDKSVSGAVLVETKGGTKGKTGRTQETIITGKDTTNVKDNSDRKTTQQLGSATTSGTSNGESASEVDEKATTGAKNKASTDARSKGHAEAGHNNSLAAKTGFRSTEDVGAKEEEGESTSWHGKDARSTGRSEKQAAQREDGFEYTGKQHAGDEESREYSKEHAGSVNAGRKEAAEAGYANASTAEQDARNAESREYEKEHRGRTDARGTEKADSGFSNRADTSQYADNKAQHERMRNESGRGEQTASERGKHGYDSSDLTGTRADERLGKSEYRDYADRYEVSALQRTGKAISQRYGLSGVTVSQVLTEWRSTFINIDRMLVEELRPLFLYVY